METELDEPNLDADVKPIWPLLLRVSIVFVMVVVLVYFLIAFFNDISKPVPVPPDGPVQISFERYLGNSTLFHNEMVSIEGYLHHKKEQTENYDQYEWLLVDDEGNEIELIITEDGYRELFSSEMSVQTFNVTGTFKSRLPRNVIEVARIT